MVSINIINPIRASDSELEAWSTAYELAFRMQTAASEIVDIADEPEPVRPPKVWMISRPRVSVDSAFWQDASSNSVCATVPSSTEPKSANTVRMTTVTSAAG
ncbi:MAG: hypothetical protein M2R45_02912 [Verrucomicrobia subdivision 3 bacterium]|nr:hypothetical protein [Limisphaerales bacterium]MCS1415366.1 hypothetical protein [Limisphaerales bacterium]